MVVPNFSHLAFINCLQMSQSEKNLIFTTAPRMVRSSDDLHTFVANFTPGNLDANSHEKTIMMADSFFDDSLGHKSMEAHDKLPVHVAMQDSKNTDEPGSLADSYDEEVSSS